MIYLSKKQQAASADPHVEDAVPMSPEPFVTADDIAVHLKIKRRQVLEMARKGFIPSRPICFGRKRKMWRFKLSEVDQAIECGAQKSASSVPQPRRRNSNTMITGSSR
jgi:hypothetical protein